MRYKPEISKNIQVIKRTVSIALAVAFILITSISVFASEDTGTSTRTVKVGFFGYPGYHEYDGDTRTGYGADFLMLLKRYTHLDFEFVGYENTWEEMLEMLENGEIDFVTGGRRTAEREKLFDYSEMIGTEMGQLNVRDNDERFSQNNYTYLNGIVVGELSERTMNAYFRDFANANGFSYTVKNYSTESELHEALNAGEVDAITASSVYKTTNEKTIATFSVEGIYAIVKKGNYELLDEINYGIAQMNDYEKNWQDNLYYDNYVSGYTQKYDFTERELAYIKAVQDGEKTITVTSQPERNPYSYVKDGKLTGIIPDYFKHLMDMVELPYTTLIPENQDEYLDWMHTNYTNVIMDCPYDKQVSSEYNFGLTTDAYMQVTVSRVTKKDFSGTIETAATLTSLTDGTFDEITFEGVHCITFDSLEDAMSALKNGNVDACYVYSYMAEKYINTDSDNTLSSSVMIHPSYDVYIYISPDTDHELCSILNKCIKMDTPGIIDTYINKYTSVTNKDVNILQFFRLHPDYVILIASAVIIIIGVAVLIICLNNRNKRIQLEQAYKMAEAGSKAKGDFLRSISHDIRTPMNAIIGYTDMTKKITDDARVHEYLDKLEISGKQLLDLINQCLELSHIESGKIELEEIPSDVIERAGEIETVYSANAASKGISYELIITNITHRYVMTDKTRVNQIVSNILGNAIKYTPSGGKITYTLEEKECQQPGFGLYCITVSDTGIGMSKEYLDHLFEEFTREDSQTISGIQGSGLGMSIVNKLVHILNGTIHVDSEKGKGTTVTVCIPMKWDEEARASKDIEQAAAICLEGVKVLLVEDNEMNREIATAVLEENGIIVFTAEDGDTAVEKVKNSKPGDFDIILMDLQMPRMNGLEATKAIRSLSDRQLADIPIIAMTANAFAEDRQAALDAGMNEHVGKPVDTEKLKEVIRRFI